MENEVNQELVKNVVATAIQMELSRYEQNALDKANGDKDAKVRVRSTVLTNSPKGNGRAVWFESVKTITGADDDDVIAAIKSLSQYSVTKTPKGGFSIESANKPKKVVNNPNSRDSKLAANIAALKAAMAAKANTATA